ncbi:hypothetical protein [Flavobacterium sp.]|uniref:hypothetical protein n=1 Tax=Flavobacterium sp. TaxID=239 RepID=UPI002612B888|nr:hypothetical protein [Flavobacterium sp.]
MTKESKKVCFVISPIGEEGSETRERSDQVLRHIISGPAEQLGYTVIRADKISEPGIITTQIIEHIVDAELVIADLTEKNPNVFYELAIRHAIRKPLVQLIKKGEIIPFDVAATRIIQFDLHNLDSVANAKDEITSQVKSLELGNNETHNPISVSLDLKVLKESGNIEERSLADIVEAISDLRLAVTSVDKGLWSSKVFEEFKTMIENLPSRIENRLDPDFRKRKRRFHPLMLDDMMYMEMKSENQNFSFLMMISFLKDDFPWLHEIGLETYRAMNTTKSKVEKIKLVENFERALEMLNHPIYREMYGKSEEVYMFMKEIRHALHHYLDKFIINTEKK